MRAAEKWCQILDVHFPVLLDLYRCAAHPLARLFPLSSSTLISTTTDPLLMLLSLFFSKNTLSPVLSWIIDGLNVNSNLFFLKLSICRSSSKHKVNNYHLINVIQINAYYYIHSSTVNYRFINDYFYLEMKHTTGLYRELL